MTMTLRRADHLAIAREFAAVPTDWPLAPRFNAAKRWSHRLCAPTETNPAEVWLLTWLPGQGTDVHDHGGSAGAFMVVEGELTEETFATPEPQTTRLAAGNGRGFDAHHVHRVSNQSTRPAVSIHVYAPALTTMTQYRMEDGKLVVAAIERAGVQW